MDDFSSGYGDMRGGTGTPAVYLNDSRYLSIFHLNDSRYLSLFNLDDSRYLSLFHLNDSRYLSLFHLDDITTNGTQLKTYVFGANVFDSKLHFIQAISRQPLVHESMYTGP
jgi:hypothetical protein